MKIRSIRLLSHAPRALLACACALACALAAAGCSRSEPPTGTVRYETEGAVVNMGLLLHGYTWNNATADVYSPNEMADDDVPDIEVLGTTEVRATFSESVRHAEVWRYLDDPEGESVECDYTKEQVSFEVEPGWRYRVAVTFEGGDAGYLFDVKGAEGAEMDGFVSTAMVVTFGDGEVLFVDQDSESPYYPTLPEGTPELTAGNIVRVTGNGIMLESYPGQYPGITKVEVIEKGTPADAEKYDELVAQIWQPKDPSEPAFASLDYTTELAATSVMLNPFRSTWTSTQDGETQTVAGDVAQLEPSDLPYARIGNSVDATLSFDVTPTSVTVGRRSVLSSSTSLESVTVELGEKSAELIIEPGYLYVIDASFEAGEVSYAFVTETSSTGASTASDPANPPVAMVERAGESVYPLSCGSTWTFEQDGETLTVTTDAPHPVQYAAEGMPAVSLEGSETLVMSFDTPATDATVERWSEADIAEAAAGEESVHDVDPAQLSSSVVEAVVEDGVVSFEAEPGFRYAVTATFDAGEAIYVLTVR